MALLSLSLVKSNLIKGTIPEWIQQFSLGKRGLSTVDKTAKSIYSGIFV